MLVDSGEESRIFAGGTALLLALRQRMITPSHLVYLGGVPGLDRIEYDEKNGLRIGALVKHAEIADSAVVKARYPMLADMAAHVANPQIRNMGTLGGNLCYADPATDPPTCLLALGARVVAVSHEDKRVIEIDDFNTDYYETALRTQDVLTDIHVPPMAANTTGAYTRFLRTPADHRPLIGLGVVAQRQGDACRSIRIAIGGSTPMSTRARRAEQYLEGKTITLDALAEAAEIAASDISPLSDFRGSAEYRRDMVRVVARRTLASVFGLASNQRQLP
jgi:carbon-monoxide dehydrogenase medium subunit